MVECCAYVTGTEWVTGSSDGALALWSQLKKKPVAVVRGAHNAGPTAASADVAAQRSTVSMFDESCSGGPWAVRSTISIAITRIISTIFLAWALNFCCQRVFNVLQRVLLCVVQDAEEGVGDSTADEDVGNDRDGGANGTAAPGPGSVGGACASWVTAVGVCKGTDLLVRPSPWHEVAD